MNKKHITTFGQFLNESTGVPNFINWRSIKEVGFPLDANKKYLVTDGKDISTSEIRTRTLYKEGEQPLTKFIDWKGDENTSEDNSCCSGEICFLMDPTHWCPIDEINLPTY